MKKYPRLIFLFTAILVVMCRCYLPDTRSNLQYNDGSIVVCDAFSDYSDSTKSKEKDGFTCPLPCPDGSTTKFDVIGGSVSGVPYSKKVLQAQYCTAGAAAAPTATIPPAGTMTPAPTATETPIAAAPIQPVAAPLLTGQVTTCDLDSRFINFRLVQGAPVITGNEVVLTMNGAPLKCTVPPSNKTILSCLLPAGVKFPVQVSIAIGDSVANQFSYNGDECFYVEPTKTGAPTSPPASTPTPI